VAWDAARPVPWKRLLTFVSLYSLVVLAIFAVLRPNEILQSVPGIVVGGLVALALMAFLTKFGWNPTMLRSRAEIAEARAQRAAAKRTPSARTGSTPTSSSSSAAAAEPEGLRPKPPPTRRTSTGATNNPRRTRATRRR
jgi:hypothetical protein